ncbi:molybdopterin-guanine dinucleotide biosynthesis protein MobA [Frankia sp. R43]|uniref:DUF6457 domain-containing protein n=1 Tax=Frankia sp. R43 TaxID=269536 RepID=UPI0006CA1553|nr:DUF6457 domain-containing protein [Frankia sp. R43]KPM57145.1 molybdopterin-guanine dinucleotide biosynthesis protein MobA [Frankia sp. R43]
MTGSTNANRPQDGGIEAVLDEWMARVMPALGLAPDSVDATLVLDLTRDVAHGVARPAAPLTAFLVGLAAGRAGGDSSAVRAAVDTVLALLPAGDSEP